MGAKRLRVAVVGVGGSGSAALRHLAQAGHTAVGFERFRVGHEQGSSHGASRIIRYTYPDLLYTTLMGDAYPLWKALEEEAQESLLVTCGGLFLGNADDPNVVSTESALREAGLPYERLDAKTTQSRFPAFRLAPHEVALCQEAGGLLRATRCVLANVRLALSYGATLHEETVVSDIVSQGDEVVVRTEAGEEQVFDRVVVTTGAWMGRLFAELNLPLTVTRQQILYFQIAENETHFQQGTLPVWIDATQNFYGFPEDGSIAGVKLASHDFGEPTDPNAARREVDAPYIERVRAYARKRFPDLSGEVTHAQTCLYTVAPNEDFILDSPPDAPNIYLVSGCSGHGFKFTVLLGKIAALWAQGEAYKHSLGQFSLVHALKRE